MNTRQIGTEYEALACEVLEKQGMQILERNYRVKIGEIDIIAKDRDEIVFVEVKYRKDTTFGGAEAAIPYAKQNKIRKVAAWYLKERRLPSSTFLRFDAVLIDGEHIEHIKQAW